MMSSLKAFGSFLLVAPLFVIHLSNDGLFPRHVSSGEPGIHKSLIQTDSLVKNELVETIRLATKKFRDPQEARDAGYRPMGPDMPNMGVHWINTGLAVQRSLDFEKPSTLTYLHVNGSLKLTGVAYTSPVKTDENAPDLPINTMKWHYHSGNLEKEAHGIHSEQMRRSENTDMNLAMLHAWIWSENPDGIFSADNWALSYHRHGFNPPEDINPDVSKALFLADGNVDYFMKFIQLCIEPGIFYEEEIRQIVSGYSSQISEMLQSYEAGHELSEEHSEHIAAEWNEMWQQVKLSLGPERWQKIEIHLNGHDH